MNLVVQNNQVIKIFNTQLLHKYINGGHKMTCTYVDHHFVLPLFFVEWMRKIDWLRMDNFADLHGGIIFLAIFDCLR